MFLLNYKDFIKTIYNHLENLEVNTSKLQIDHLGYQASSSKDYNNKIELIKNLANKVSENIVGGRKVAIFKLNNPLEYETHSINIFEIFEPVLDQIVESHWEHIEFLADGSLEDLIAMYPLLNWDKSKMHREEFPQLILKLSDKLRAKFPRRGVLEELERQK